MSYQRDVEDFMKDDNEVIEVPTKNSNSAKALAILSVSVLAIFGLAGYSSYGSTSTTSTSLNAKLTASRVQYLTLSHDEKQELFSNFKEKFGREYTSEEETVRYNVFLSNLKLIDERNAKEAVNNGAVHGITKFSDISQEEFEALLGFTTEGFLTGGAKTFQEMFPDKLVSSIVKKAGGGNNKMKSNSTDDDSSNSTSTDDDSTDDADDSTDDDGDDITNWADIYTTAVKDQGYCGSCWAFSATEQIESDSIRAGILTTSDELSPQQIVSCDPIDAGCDGGNPYYAYQYVMGTGGLASDDDYPYTSYYDVTGTCYSNSSEYEVTITDFYIIHGRTSTLTETLMEEYMESYGPISVCLDASAWSSYTSGVVTTCGDDVDHCIQFVGINQGENYWIVRNSWGTDWGVDGYLYLESGSNLCDLTYLPTYTDAAEV